MELLTDGTGDTNVQNFTKDEFGNHGSFKHMTSVLNAVSEEFQFKPLANKQVQEAMKMLNPRKATGYDKIEPRILKIGAEELAPYLTSIFNQSITKGAWVTQWKHGKWVPVFKKDDRQEDENYRPITVLAGVDKLYEKLLGKFQTLWTYYLMTPSLLIALRWLRNYAFELVPQIWVLLLSRLVSF